ncbi:hypothetical protein MKEN_00413600 [Mycena kentingensis (nom. inval.)]|nr:hypothetical protein MKEN_00413600 [Mycena kentingensis (nom. inval.)]
MFSPLLVILPLFVAVHAKNDWNVPCTSGSCSYDLPQNGNSASSGTLKIWGGENAITDITAAADWEILECDPNAAAQDIRLVCKNDPDDPNSLCSHLYQNIGAENKIVRLPENCGKSAFARVSKAWVPEDQSIPTDIAKRLVRRAGVPPIVKALRLDTNWEAVNWKKTGQVNFAVQAGNVPGVPTTITTGGTVARRIEVRRQDKRGFLDGLKNVVNKVGDAFEDAGNAIKNTAEDVVDAAKDVGEKVVDVAKDAGEAIVDTAKDVGNAVVDAAKDVKNVVEDINNFNKSESFGLPPIQFDKSANLINSSIDCLGKSLALNVDVSANADVLATITLIAGGTFIPPNIKQLGAAAIMTGKIGGTIAMQADVSGFLDSGFIPLFNVGVPGFDFPEIFELGPTFTVDATIRGEVDLTMDMSVGVQMDLNKTRIAFPPNLQLAPEEQTVGLGDAPLSMNAAADVAFTGSIIATLRPSLNLGLSVARKAIQGEVFLALDASAVATLDLAGSAFIAKDKNGGATPAPGTEQEELDAETLDNASADGAFDAEEETAGADQTVEEGNEEIVEDEVADEDEDATDEPADEAVDTETFDAEDPTASDEEIATDDEAASDEETVVADDETDVATEDETIIEDETVADSEDVDETTLEDEAINDPSIAVEDPDVVTDATVVAPPTKLSPAQLDALTGTKAAVAARKTPTVAKKVSVPTKKTAGAVKKVPVPVKKPAARKPSVSKTVSPSDESTDGELLVDIERRQQDANAEIEDAELAVIDDTTAEEQTELTGEEATDEISDEELTDEEITDEELTDEELTDEESTDEGLEPPDSASASEEDQNVQTTVDANGDVTTTSSTFGGCVNIAAQIQINVGADGGFLGLFSAVKQKALFTKDFQIFTKCFGDQAGTEDQFATGQAVADGVSGLGAVVPVRRRAAIASTTRRRTSTTLERRINLVCPFGSGTKAPITRDTVSKSNIKTKGSKVLI